MLEQRERAARLGTVDASGRLREVSFTLPSRRTAALVADPGRERAYVIGRRRVVAVDLRRMRVRRHRVRLAGNPNQALWLGKNLIAVAARGLSVINTKTWTAREIDPKATGVATAPGRLLALGPRGLRGYTRKGRPVFELLRGKPIWAANNRGKVAYVTTPRATYVVDTRSGRVRRRMSRVRAVEAVIPGRCRRP